MHVAWFDSVRGSQLFKAEDSTIGRTQNFTLNLHVRTWFNLLK